MRGIETETLPELASGTETWVLAAGYEEVTAEGVTSGLLVVQFKVTLQVLEPRAIVQEAGVAVRVPDIPVPVV